MPKQIKRVMLLIQEMGFGGAERVMSNLANYFSENNIKVLLVTLHGESAYKLNPKIQQVKIDTFNNDDLPSIIKLVPKYLRRVIFARVIRLQRLAKEFKPDVALCFLEVMTILGPLSLKGLGIPVVVSERNNPALHFTRDGFLKHIFFKLANGCIFQTKSVSNYFSRSIRKKSVVIPNPVFLPQDVQRFQGDRDKVIVGVGRLEAQKNFELLIKAFHLTTKEFPEYKLIIYGEGNERNKLESLIQSLNLQGKVELPGTVQDIHKKIVSASLFVFSSKYEGFPNALLEAVALGIPSISTDCPFGPNEIIKHIKNGILVPVDNPEALADAMKKLLSDKSTCNSFSTEGEKVREMYSSEIICKKYLDYLTLIAHCKRK